MDQNGAKYIYQDSKLLASLDCFAKLVETGFRVKRAEQLDPYT